MLGNSPPSALKHRSSTLLIAPPRLVTRVFSVPLPFQINCEISRSIAVAIDVDYVTEKKKKKEKEERRPYDTARACKRRETVYTLSFLLLLSVFFFFPFSFSSVRNVSLSLLTPWLCVTQIPKFMFHCCWPIFILSLVFRARRC